jgi:hypothetical protein
MKWFRLFTLVTVLLFSACERSDNAKGTPGCLDNSIAEFKLVACANGANVKEYVFQGKTVYAMCPGNCGADMVTSVIDSACNILGSLGGIAGNTRINGAEFSNATYIRTIWQN